MEVDLAYLASLNLKEAFSGESAFEKIEVEEDYLTELFEQTDRSSVFVCDDENRGFSCFVNDTNGIGRDRVFFIKNVNHRIVFLMRIDGVLFDRRSKCDCAVLFGREMDFIEFKTNAGNKTEVSMDAQYSKSYSQLLLSVKEFDKRYDGMDASFRDRFEVIQAYAVFNPTVPNSNASQKRLAAQFAKETKIKLSFTNSKSI